MYRHKNIRPRMRPCSREQCPNLIIRQVSDPVHTYPVFLKTEVFSSVLPLRPHVNGVFGDQKRRFSKTLSRVEIFENAGFAYTCGRAKT